jgi:hypothetical protein
VNVVRWLRAGGQSARAGDAPSEQSARSWCQWPREGPGLDPGLRLKQERARRLSIGLAVDRLSR